MKKLRIGAKIFLGFALILVFLLGIALTSVISALRTGTNIDKVDTYSGLQNSANELMHILNETRISAGVFYATHSAESFGNVSKQLMYSDMRLDKLYAYIDANPELGGFRPEIESFQELYDPWRTGITQMGAEYPLDDTFSEAELASFTASAEEMHRVNLLCHEKLSNTILDMGDTTQSIMQQTKSFSSAALYIVIAVSVLSLFASLALAVVIVRSITIPMKHMQDVLRQIGQSGDLQVPEQTQQTLQLVAAGKDETAQCTAALLVLVDHLHSIDGTLSHVADGNLSVDVALQSQQDTMGLAVQKMVENLSQKFNTIVQSTNQVYQKADELAEGSNLLASGSRSQSESVAHLAESVQEVGQRTERNTQLAAQATDLVGKIQDNAQVGTEKMNQMIQAANDINTASQAIGDVIKTIDDIAFQTNILALNAAVEAARAGQHGKGFAVVADEVRNLATKSAAAAKDSGALIENTIQKAALGASIAETTSESLEEIVQGVQQSNTIIGDIASLSAEQLLDIQQIIADVGLVESIVQQNNSISTQSAKAAAEISDQTNLLKELVAQFQLREATHTISHQLPQGGVSNEIY